jgi:hypothetical protein
MHAPGRHLDRVGHADCPVSSLDHRGNQPLDCSPGYAVQQKSRMQYFVSRYMEMCFEYAQNGVAAIKMVPRSAGPQRSELPRP